MTWEREQAYTAKRAEKLMRDMDEAINRHDRKAFEQLYEISMRYLRKPERDHYMREFIRTNY